MRAPQLRVGPYRSIELSEPDLPRLQAFFEANPDYFRIVYGAPAGPNEGRDEFAFRPPPDMPCGPTWWLALVDDAGVIVAVASGVRNLLAPRVWHIGLFMVGEFLHGHGIAREFLGALERWMHDEGAAWVRLGAVVGNVRAERFWERMGYVEVRRRNDVTLGTRTHVLRVMAKALAGGTMEEYRDLVARDRPETP